MKIRTARKLSYLKKARHRHGHGIHSPFLFYLITDVIENKKQLSAYEVLRDQRDRLSVLIKNNTEQLGLQTFSDTILKSSGRKNLFKAIELPIRYGKLLLRLVNEFKPESISYLGPTFGLNLLYLALSKQRSVVEFSQSDNSVLRICQSTLVNAGVQNIKLCDQEDFLKGAADFVVVNFPFSPEEAEKAIRSKLESAGKNDVLIIRGIHESKRMESIWKDLIRDNRVRVSLDLFEIGIALFQINLQKEHFILRY